MAENEGRSTTDELTNDQKRENLIRVAFGGNAGKFNEFVEAVRETYDRFSGRTSRPAPAQHERRQPGT